MHTMKLSAKAGVCSSTQSIIGSLVAGSSIGLLPLAAAAAVGIDAVVNKVIVGIWLHQMLWEQSSAWQQDAALTASFPTCSAPICQRIAYVQTLSILNAAQPIQKTQTSKMDALQESLTSLQASEHWPQAVKRMGVKDKCNGEISLQAGSQQMFRSRFDKWDWAFYFADIGAVEASEIAAELHKLQILSKDNISSVEATQAHYYQKQTLEALILATRVAQTSKLDIWKVTETMQCKDTTKNAAQGRPSAISAHK
ncbi:hypothetical protein WJX77_007810 [Trebouxia sp. C0004]